MHTDKTGIADFLTRHVVLSATVLLLLIRLVAWFNTAIISRDSVIYIELARDWASGQYLKALAHPYHPLYSFLIAVASKGFGFSYEPAAVGISIVASALTLPALFTIFRRVKDEKVLFLGLTFFCISPYLVRYAADVLTEPFYLLFVAWAAAFWVEAGLQGGKNAVFCFLSGIFTGLAYLTRPEGLVVAIAGVLWFLTSSAKKGHMKELLSCLLSLTVGIFLIASPYLLYLHRDTGQWLVTRKKRVGTLLEEISNKKNFHKASNLKKSLEKSLPKGTSKKRAAFLLNRRLWQQEQANKIRQILGEPIRPKAPLGASPWCWLLAFIESLGSVILGFLNGMFIPVGIWVVFRFMSFKRYPWNRVDTFILVFSALYWVILGILLCGYGYVSRRHYSAVAMFWFLWAAIGLIYACNRMASFFRNSRLTPKFVGIIFLIPILGISVVKGTRPYRMDKYGRKVVGKWISGRKPKGRACSVLTSMTRVSYYAGCRTIFLPTLGERDVNALRRHEIDFVVLNRREVKETPVLMKLLEKYGYHEVYHYISAERHEDIRIFSFKGLTTHAS